MKALCKFLALLTLVCLVLSAGAELLPNGDFQLYKPGEPTVTPAPTGGWVPWNGVISPTNLSISGGGSANYGDSTTGTTVDLPGWTKIQGNADILGNGPGGSLAFNAFGSWGGQTRIRSANSPGTTQAGGVYTISVMVGGPADGPIQGPLASPEKPGSATWGNAVTRICTWASLHDRRTVDGLLPSDHYPVRATLAYPEQ